MFSALCYYAWGDGIVEPLITELLPASDIWVQIVKLLFCINLIYSYRICIVPTFNTLETYILGIKETNKDEDKDGELEAEEDNATYWKVNALRSFVIACTVLIVLVVADYLDKFYALSGAILGMTNVLLLPSICHLKLVSVTRA